MPDPALMVGPQDPDNTAELTARYGVANNAIELLTGVADNQPAELMSLLALPTDQDRSDALVLAEVERAAGDLLDRTEVIDGEERSAYLAAAYVKGNDPRSRVVTITYVVPSGRTGKASLGSYDEFPQSQAAFEELRRAKMGVASESSRLGKAAGDDSVPDPASPEIEAMRESMDEMHRELRELRARQAEPVEGFSELNATDSKAAIADFDASQLDKAEELERGRGEKTRSSVTDAIEKRRTELEQQKTDLAALEAARATGRDPLADPEPETGDGGEGGSGDGS